MYKLPKFMSQRIQYRSLTAITQLNQLNKPPKLNIQKDFEQKAPYEHLIFTFNLPLVN